METSVRIGMGAEAVIEETEYLGMRAVRKTRTRKGYRHEVLDARLRSGRTKNEVRVMREARASGVRTPVVYDVDTHEGSIVMEFVDGTRVREIIDSEPGRIPDVCRKIGESVANFICGS